MSLFKATQLFSWNLSYISKNSMTFLIKKISHILRSKKWELKRNKTWSPMKSNSKDVGRWSNGFPVEASRMCCKIWKPVYNVDNIAIANTYLIQYPQNLFIYLFLNKVTHSGNKRPRELILNKHIILKKILIPL